jgi:hypothetical protein
MKSCRSEHERLLLDLISRLRFQLRPQLSPKIFATASLDALWSQFLACAPIGD